MEKPPRVLHHYKVWMDNGALIYGMAHVPPNIRDSDWFVNKSTDVVILTNCTVYHNSNIIESPTLVLNKSHICYFEPPQK